jgi:nucleoside 2-deoxyribosyltransferase
MKLIYIAHPFDGKQENIDKVQAIILDLALKLPDHTFYSPLHATGFLYEELSYLDGMEHCFEALNRCDGLWLCGEWRESRGCNMEYGFAKAKGIPVKFITEVD